MPKGKLLTDSMLVLRHANAAIGANGVSAEQIPLPVQVGAGLVLAVYAIEVGLAGFPLDPGTSESEHTIWLHRSNSTTAAQTGANALTDDDALVLDVFKCQIQTSGVSCWVNPEKHTFGGEPILIFQDMSLRADATEFGAAMSPFVTLYYRVRQVSDAELGRLALLSAS